MSVTAHGERAAIRIGFVDTRPDPLRRSGRNRLAHGSGELICGGSSRRPGC